MSKPTFDAPITTRRFEQARRVWAALTAHPNATARELSAESGVYLSGVYTALSDLAMRGYITKHGVGRSYVIVVPFSEVTSKRYERERQLELDELDISAYMDTLDRLDRWLGRLEKAEDIDAEAYDRARTQAWEDDE